MGIVKISDVLHNELRHASQLMTRSINAQAEHWIKMGMFAELNPDLTYSQLIKKMMQDSALLLQGKETDNERHSD